VRLRLGGATYKRGRRVPVLLVASTNLTIHVSSTILTSVMDAADAAVHATSEDPALGLRAVASLRALAEATEELHVRRARELGWSWQQIAACLNVSKQGLHQKYGKPRRGGRRGPQ
jgi:hypothetical protein